MNFACGQIYSHGIPQTINRIDSLGICKRRFAYPMKRAKDQNRSYMATRSYGTYFQDRFLGRPWAIIGFGRRVGDILSMPFYHPVLEEGLRSAFRKAAHKLRMPKPQFEMLRCQDSVTG